MANSTLAQGSDTSAVIRLESRPTSVLDSPTDRGSWDFSDLGSWIWDEKTFDNQTCRMWKAFEIPSKSRVVSARLRITVDNSFALFLDGRQIGRGDDWRDLFDYDITMLLTPGRHILAVEAFNSAREAGMILGLRIQLADGQLIEIKSDQSWYVVPAGLSSWEKKSRPLSNWPQAKIVSPFGETAWGWWKQPWRLDVQPPLQPDFVPFWQRGWFHMTLLAVGLAVTIIILRLMAQLALHAKEQGLLDRERSRIARDIHDDLGTRMTKLVLDGEVAQSELPPDSAAAEQFLRMCEGIREVLQATDEILWAMNPQRDSLRDFSAFVCRYAGRFLKPAQIQCLLDVDPDISAVTFDLPLRRSLLMAVKEALHNAVKHSEATELMLEIHRQGEGLVVIVEDNGKGFDPKLASHERNGLANMAQRLDEMGGTCQITSQPGKGCRVQFSIPRTQVRRFPWWIKSPAEHRRSASSKINEASEIAAIRGHGTTDS